MQLTIALIVMLGDMAQQAVLHRSAQANVRAAGTRWQTLLQVRVQMTVSRVMRASMV